MRLPFSTQTSNKSMRRREELAMEVSRQPSNRSLDRKKNDSKNSKDNQGKAQSQAQKASAKRQAITEILFFACVGSIADCKRLIKQFDIKISDPSTADYDKRTPLHLASAEGHIDIVTWLLSKKADANAVDRFKRTPLEEAVRSDHGKIVSLLIQHKAKVVGADGNLTDLAFSHLSGNVNVDVGSDFTPDWAIDVNSINLMRRISEGSHGSTYKAKWRGTIVAVKVLRDCEQLNLGDLTVELNTMFKVHHPNTVQLLGAVINAKPYMIVYEFMTGGSVLDVIKTGGNFSQWRSLMLAIDLAKGIDHLHDRPIPIVHGDLRPSNLLLGGARIFNNYHKGLMADEMGMLKIADFGLSKTLQKHSLMIPEAKIPDESMILTKVEEHEDQPPLLALGQLYQNSESRSASRRFESFQHAGSGPLPEEDASGGEDGPFRYMAPELYRRESLTPSVDIYSFGMILYHLFECSAPFADMDPEDAARASAEGKRPEWGKSNKFGQIVPQKIKEIVEECCNARPAYRTDFPSIIRDMQEVARRMKPSVTERPRDLDDDDECCSCLG